MAFGRLARNPAPRPMSDINMTPLIDVMLVLLVIFIITAPLLTTSLKLDLPSTTAATSSEVPQFITLAIDREGRLYLGEERLDPAALSLRIQEAARRDPRTEVQLRADERVAYGRVAELIGIVQQAGLSRIGFVTETIEPK
jgi:biopolymer transport protein TolR